MRMLSRWVALSTVLLLGACTGEGPDGQTGQTGTGTTPNPDTTLTAVLTAPALTLEPRVGAVKARWQSVNKAASYRLYWRDAYNAAIAVEMGEQLSYDHTGLLEGQTYYYQVAALDADGAEQRSQEVGATVPAASAGPKDDAGP